MTAREKFKVGDRVRFQYRADHPRMPESKPWKDFAHA